MKYIEGITYIVLIGVLILGGYTQELKRVVDKERGEHYKVVQHYNAELYNLRMALNYFSDSWKPVDGSYMFDISPIPEDDFKRFTSPFGLRLNPLRANMGGESKTDHKGVDMTGTYEARVVSVGYGTVIEKWYSPGYHNGRYYRGHPVFGGLVKIEHTNGFVTVYGHLGDIYVHEGDFVREGQIIGRVGEGVEGKSTGPHLHFAVVDSDGDFVQPFKYVKLEE